MAISIVGIGIVSALGAGLDSLKEGLAGKRNPHIQEFEITTADGVQHLPVYVSNTKDLSRFVSRSALRRSDHLTKMALLASHLAFEESGLSLKDKTRVGIVFGTGYGPLETTFKFLDSVIDYGDKCASPTLFANSVHNSLVSQVSITLKLQGPSMTLTSFDHVTSSVLSTASWWLNQDMADYVLVGVGDEYCEVRGYAKLLAASGKGNRLTPSNLHEFTHLPGEGFAAFLLTKKENDQGNGSLLSIHSGDRKYSPARADHLFIAANGEREIDSYCKDLISQAPHAVSHSPLFGAMPAGNGFDIAIAALSLQEGYLYGGTKTCAPTSLRKKAKIECAQFGKYGTFSSILLESGG